jgi:colicin import membrane protein
MTSIFFTTILIATQAFITPAMAQNRIKNEGLNTEKNAGLSAPQNLASTKQEKAVIDANLKTQQAACYKKFAVNNCLKDAKIEAQTALNAVKRREAEINAQQRNAKIDLDLTKKEKIAAKNAENNISSDKASEIKDKTKDIKTTKSGKAVKTDAEILLEKKSADKSRVDIAQKRLVELNQKQVVSQKKVQSRVSKNSQSSANAAKYSHKLARAEEYKQALEKTTSAKNKPKSTPLPIPAAPTP